MAQGRGGEAVDLVSAAAADLARLEAVVSWLLALGLGSEEGEDSAARARLAAELKAGSRWVGSPGPG